VADLVVGHLPGKPAASLGLGCIDRVLFIHGPPSHPAPHARYRRIERRPSDTVPAAAPQWRKSGINWTAPVEAAIRCLARIEFRRPATSISRLGDGRLRQLRPLIVRAVGPKPFAALRQCRNPVSAAIGRRAGWRRRRSSLKFSDAADPGSASAVLEPRHQKWLPNPCAKLGHLASPIQILQPAFPIRPKSAETNKPWGRKVISRNMVEVLIPAQAATTRFWSGAPGTGSPESSPSATIRFASSTWTTRGFIARASESSSMA